jgi:hypothetical protein
MSTAAASQGFICRVPGAPGSGFWYPGLGVASALHFILDIQPLTFDFQLLIPVRVRRVARSIRKDLLGGLPFRFWLARRRRERVGSSSLFV